MREYIDKQELNKRLLLKSVDLFGKESKGFGSACRIVKELPIYTQADLESLAYNRGARAFAEKLKEETDCSKEEKDIIDELLEEMGCCDE